MITRAALRWIRAFGIDPRQFLRACRGLPPALVDYLRLRKQFREHAHISAPSFAYPMLADRFDDSGVASGHYFYQDLIVARRIYKRNPRKHVDVASRIDGFVAHVAVFRQIEVMDIRPLRTEDANIIFHQADILNLPPRFMHYCDSLSCLHALEHLGLGRYGDAIDIDGHLSGLDALQKILQPRGILYLSVPIGRERIEFNAHRIFSIRTVLEMISPWFVLESFSFIDDEGHLHADQPITAQAMNDSYGLDYGCGVFELRKRSR